MFLLIYCLHKRKITRSVFTSHMVFKITYKNQCEWIDQNLKNDIARRETEIPHRRKC